MGSKGNNGGGGGGGLQSIPESSRRIVKSLKEVVTCPEAEIYAMLKDCNMDPNEAVNRLLSQDPFHEVKSKREKKKENKNTTEPKSRGTNTYSSRGGRGGSDHYAGRGGTHFSSSESGTSHGKPAYKKENGTPGYGSHSSVPSGTRESNVYQRPPVHSDYVAAENKNTITETVDGGWGSRPSSGNQNQPAWGGVPGQKSMAEIVKMGRPQPKPNQSQSGSYNPRSNPSYHDINSSEVSPDVEWPLAEPSTRISPVVQPSSDWHTENIINQHQEETEQYEAPAVEDASLENISGNHDGYAPVTGSGRMQNNNNSEVASSLNSDGYENMEPYQPHANAVVHREVEDTVPSVISNMQQLKVVEEREDVPLEEEEEEEREEAAVIIPDHLQVQTEDCLHLSFGSFGSFGAAGPASSSVPFSSRPINNISIEEEVSADRDTPSVGHLDTRTTDYYGDESLRTGADGNLVHRTGTSGSTAYDSSSISQSEVFNQETREDPCENQYDFPSSNYSFENSQQTNASFPPSQTNAQTQTFSNQQQAYANSLPSSLLGASGQSVRESDYSYSPFAMGGQSMPAKYGTTVSSVNNSTASMPEVLKAAGFSSNLQTQQNPTGSNIATGPAIPQHLMHQYSQMAPFANLFGYPFMPQNYYMAGAYQQAAAFAGNNAYHQSLLPQYKNSVSVSSLPQSAAVASGYGGSFGSSTSLPGGNFPANQASPPGGATPVGYEDVLSSQYKDASHLLALQHAQNENQAMWVQGHGGSRTMSGIPAANTYYSSYQQPQQSQQQPQPSSGFRQNQQQQQQQQQLPQNYGAALGNPNNFYHSQSGMLLDHHHQQQQQQQLQNPRDGGSHLQAQAAAKQQQSQQQLWQNTY